MNLCSCFWSSSDEIWKFNLRTPFNTAFAVAEAVDGKKIPVLMMISATILFYFIQILISLFIRFEKLNMVLI
ncbi:hypothetical protein Sjap_004560 [Stephania japonica]|uniref:Uncharacterized protein n=1 Tax=Stephania japonica TaxID=461633 RepID=A0AAP0K2K3_9MAGN